MSGIPLGFRPRHRRHGDPGSRPGRHLQLVTALVVDLAAYRRERARAQRLRMRMRVGARAAPATPGPSVPACPGCRRRVLAERPGYWWQGWGMPAPVGCHLDRSPLCLDPATSRPYPYPRPALALVTS